MIEKSQIVDMPIKTVNDLQKNVLFYGLNKNMALQSIDEKFEEKKMQKRPSMDQADKNLFNLLKMSTKNLIKTSLDLKTKNEALNNNKTEESTLHDIKLKKIHRGFSARRYLRNLTKNWDQNLLDTFISDGKLNEDTVYEKNENKRKRLDDDLTILPQAYTFDQTWYSATVDMRSYKFLKVNDFNTTKTYQEETIRFKLNNDSESKKVKQEPIKIYNDKIGEVSYNSLNINEKEKVLSELLFHSVLNNMNKHRIGDPNNPNITYSKDLASTKTNDKIEIHIKNFPEAVFNDTDKDNENYIYDNEFYFSQKSELNRFKKFENSSDFTSNLTQSKFEQINLFKQKQEKSSFNTSFKKTILEPTYMFGKYSGAPWVVNKKLAEKEKTYLNDLKSIKSSYFVDDDTQIKSSRTTKAKLITPELKNSFTQPEFRRFTPTKSSKSRGSTKTGKSIEVNSLKEWKTFSNFQSLNKEIDNMDSIIVDQEIKNSQKNFDLTNIESFYKENNSVEENVEISRREYYLEEMRSEQDGFALEDGSRSTFKYEMASLKSDSINRFNITEKKNKRERTIFSKENNELIETDMTVISNLETIQNDNIEIEQNKSTLKIVTIKEKQHDTIKNDLNKDEFKNKFEQLKPTNKSIKAFKTESETNVRNLEAFKTRKNFKENLPKINDFKSSSFNLSKTKEILNDVKNVKKISEEKYDKNEYESLKRPLKPKIDLFGSEKKLPKLKFLKNDDFSKNGVPSFSLGRNSVNESYYENDYAKVEMMKLKPKPNGFDILTKKTPINTNYFYSNKSQTDQAKFYNNINNNKLNVSFNKENLIENDNYNSQTIDKETYSKTKLFKVPNINAQIQQSNLIRQEVLDKQQFNTKPRSLNDNLKKRTVNWSGGDFDPREFFMLWSYETPQAPILVDKTFADSLRKYAELMAKNVLSNKNAGVSLSDDIRRALRNNLVKLKEAIAQGKISREVLEEYKNIFKNVLAKVLKRKDLENVEIDDEMLFKLLELPSHAFEVYKDPITGKETLRIKSSFLREQNKVIRTIVTEKSLNKDDFEIEVDPVTGEKKYKLKNDIAKKLGIPEGSEDLFEVYTDENGNQMLKLKNGARNVTIGNTIYELVTDPNTGKQVLRMTTKQKVGEEKLEDILRLADNMSPDAKHKYLQDLLKTSGHKMDDNTRRKLIDEILKNSNNLTDEERENFLKDMMVNLVNELEPELAKKVLHDIMKSTDNLDSSLKEKMIKNLLNNLSELPEELKEQTLKELINNIENLSSEVKHNLLQDILDKVEHMGSPVGTGLDLRNQVLKEMLKNSQNLDEETRNRIIHQVLDKITIENEGEVPPTVLEELVKQIYSLPDQIKEKVMLEVKKNIERGDLDKNLLAELLKNSDNLSGDILEAIVKNSYKLESSALKELVKNLDKLPDELKQEMINNMLNNLSEMDSTVQQQFLKELMTNPSLIQDKELRDKVIKEIMSNLNPNDIAQHTENMSAEEKNKFLQDLLKRADDLTDETRQQIIEMILKNAEGLDQEKRNNLLIDFVQNIAKDLPPDLAAKLIADLMKTTQDLDPSVKQIMIENLLNNMDNLSDEVKQKALQELVKNLDDLAPDKKQEILKNILTNLDNLPENLRDETLKTIVNNMNNLSSEQKNQLLQNILEQVENSSNGDLTKQLKNEILKEIVKNSENLDSETRTKILSDVIERLNPTDLNDVPNEILNELVKQMNNLPDEIKQTVLNEIKKSIEKGNISGEVLDQLFKNKSDLSNDLLEKVVNNINNLGSDTLKKLVKNLDNLPDELKEKAVKDMLKNIDQLDPNVKKQLLKELVSKPGMIKDKKVFENAVLDLIDNIEKMPDNIKKDMLKDIAKNINNLSDNVKHKVIKEVFNNLKDSSDETREEIMKQLLKKMGQNELEEWVRNSDLSDEFKSKILADLSKIITSGDDLLDSDDEDELTGLTGEERVIRKKQLIDKKKNQLINEQNKNVENVSEKKDLNWLQKNKENILKNFEIDPNEPFTKISDEQLDFVRAFNKLSQEEKVKLLDSLSQEERNVLIKLNEELSKIRQYELQEALDEAKNIAIERLREQLAIKKRMDFLNCLRLESNLMNYTQQISRAFVFSYLEMIQWLDVSC